MTDLEVYLNMLINNNRVFIRSDEIDGEFARSFKQSVYSVFTDGVLVATSGCFEILHAGHVKMLESARKLGDRLVVLVNDDSYMVRVKGHCYVPLMERVAVLMALGCVDSVVWFSEDTPCNDLALMGARVFVKGGEYKGVGIPEEAVVKKVVYIDSGIETHGSGIIDRIKRGVTYTGMDSPDSIIESASGIIIEPEPFFNKIEEGGGR